MYFWLTPATQVALLSVLNTCRKKKRLNLGQFKLTKVLPGDICFVWVWRVFTQGQSIADESILSPPITDEF